MVKTVFMSYFSIRCNLCLKFWKVTKVLPFATFNISYYHNLVFMVKNLKITHTSERSISISKKVRTNKMKIANLSEEHKSIITPQIFF